MSLLDPNGRFFVCIAPDTRIDKSGSGTWTVNTTVNIAIPDDAQIIEILASADIRYNLGAAPAAEGAAAFAAGLRAQANVMTVIVLEMGTARTLQLLSAASTTVYVGWR